MTPDEARAHVPTVVRVDRYNRMLAEQAPERPGPMMPLPYPPAEALLAARRRAGRGGGARATPPVAAVRFGLRMAAGCRRARGPRRERVAHEAALRYWLPRGPPSGVVSPRTVAPRRVRQRRWPPPGAPARPTDVPAAPAALRALSSGRTRRPPARACHGHVGARRRSRGRPRAQP
jgi:hypothetical protein